MEVTGVCSWGYNWKQLSIGERNVGDKPLYDRKWCVIYTWSDKTRWLLHTVQHVKRRVYTYKLNGHCESFEKKPNARVNTSLRSAVFSNFEDLMQCGVVIYSTGIFLFNPNKRHPIHRPWGGMRCILWIQPLSYTSLECLQCCMQYNLTTVNKPRSQAVKYLSRASIIGAQGKFQLLIFWNDIDNCTKYIFRYQYTKGTVK